jgi:transposase InsO family protein
VLSSAKYRRVPQDVKADILRLVQDELVPITVGPLTVQTLANAFFNHPLKPVILSSDHGKEQEAKALANVRGITISRSRPRAPWENGDQESFCGKFTLDFGDPDRFKILGEPVAAIYRATWEYNHTRIHSGLGTPPAAFAERVAA